MHWLIDWSNLFLCRPAEAVRPRVPEVVVLSRLVGHLAQNRSQVRDEAVWSNVVNTCLEIAPHRVPASSMARRTPLVPGWGYSAAAGTALHVLHCFLLAWIDGESICKLGQHEVAMVKESRSLLVRVWKDTIHHVTVAHLDFVTDEVSRSRFRCKEVVTVIQVKEIEIGAKDTK
jgi:hypothetical protein